MLYRVDIAVGLQFPTGLLNNILSIQNLIRVVLALAQPPTELHELPRLLVPGRIEGNT